MGLRVLSLFDGMSCGMIAFKKLGCDVDEYHAYEIDKYAVKTSKHNFPEIIHHGDVFEGDIREQGNSGYERAYGDPLIDKPVWDKFYADVVCEIEKRKNKGDE